MTLLDRTRTCREAGCTRAPAYPDQNYCRDHALRWAPEWVKRAKAGTLPPKVAA